MTRTQTYSLQKKYAPYLQNKERQRKKRKGNPEKPSRAESKRKRTPHTTFSKRRGSTSIPLGFLRLLRLRNPKRSIALRSKLLLHKLQNNRNHCSALLPHPSRVRTLLTITQTSPPPSRYHHGSPPKTEKSKTNQLKNPKRYHSATQSTQTPKKPRSRAQKTPTATRRRRRSQTPET